ncbi:MAG: AI-2E family transporter [Patescibacteria group bacterium]|nr:AI-2E family transporter [Patescibacteria group bacterium]MCL5431963.1 AI-2E family transporter [Patescibacteria group bacterium]
MNLNKLPELRILIILGIIALSWHLLTVFGSFLTLFGDLLLMVILSWILAFVLEPLIDQLTKRGLSRLASAAVVYLVLAAAATIAIAVIIPNLVSQLTQLAGALPAYLPQNPVVSGKITDFLTNTLSNSVSLASGLAAGVAGLLFIFFLSFYILLSKKEISRFILDVIPDEYEEDYLFLEHVFNTTFASFLRVQVFLGLATGAITLVTLLILQVRFALSTSIFSAVLAMIPVVGAFLFLVPIILAALTASVQKMLIAVAVTVLAAQIVYNFLSPKLLGSALKIHPIVVLLSFIVGYKLTGVWGAIFAVPVVSALTIIGKDLLRYWKEEADK